MQQAITAATTKICSIADSKMTAILLKIQETERKQLDIEDTIRQLTKKSDFDNKMKLVVHAYRGKAPVVDYTSPISPYKRVAVKACGDDFNINDFISKYDNRSDDDALAIEDASEEKRKIVTTTILSPPKLPIEISSHVQICVPDLLSNEVEGMAFSHKKTPDDERSLEPHPDVILDEQYQQYDLLMANFFERVQYSPEKYIAVKRKDVKQNKRRREKRHVKQKTAVGSTPKNTPRSDLKSTKSFTTNEYENIDESDRCVSICPCGKAIHVVGNALCWDCCHGNINKPRNLQIPRPPSAGRMRPSAVVTHRPIARPRSAQEAYRRVRQKEATSQTPTLA